MAATKSRKTRAKTTTPRTAASLATRTGKAIADRPVASAAIGTGLVAGIAAALAGFFAFKKSGKSFPEFSSDVADSVKDKAATAKSRIKDAADDATTFVKDGIADVKTKAQDLADRRKDGVETGDRSQAEIAEEALTLKTVSKRKTKTPTDPVVDEQTKVGAISY